MDTSLSLILVLLIVNCVYCVKEIPRGKNSSIATQGYPTTESVLFETTPTAVFEDSVQNLTVLNVTSSSFTISWEPPTLENGVLIDSYVVYINCSNATLEDSCEVDCSTIIDTVDGDKNIYSFENAAPFTEYEVTILPESNSGSWLPNTTVIHTDEDLPDEPENLNVTERNGEVIVNWEPPKCKRGLLMSYNINISCIKSNNGPNCPCPQNNSMSSRVEAELNQTKFYGIQAFSIYSVSVSAETKKGVGNSSKIVFNTSEGVPDRPADVSVRNISSKGFTVVWDPPTCVRGELKNYVVSVEYIYEEEMNCQPPSPHSWTFSCAEHARKYSFPHGWPFSKYNVSVTAVASGGNSSSYPQEAKTLEDIPDPPVDLSVSSGFNITWKQPPCTNGLLQMYYVTITFLERAKYSEDCPSEDTKTYSFSVSPPTMAYQFTEEKPYSRYSICVHAATNVGNGRDICNNTILSAAVVLDGPGDLKVDPLNPTAANITWKTPCPITDEIMNFSGHGHGSRQGFNEIDIIDFNETAQLFYFTIKDLKPEYKYTLQMYATGRMMGKGNNSLTSFQQPAGIPGVLPNNSKTFRSSTLDTDDPTRQARVTVPTDIFDTTNGDIRYYAIFVAPHTEDQISKNGYLDTPIEVSNCNIAWPNTSYWGDVAVNGIPSREYQATPDCWNPPATDAVFTFVLGTEKPCGSHQYCNGPLHPHTEYTFKVRAYTTHGYQDTYVVPFHTDSEVAVGLTLGLVFGFLMAGTILLGFVMYRNGQISCSLTSIFNKNDIRDVCPPPIPIKNFAKHCELLLDIPGRLSSEFQLLSTLCVDINETNTFSVGRLPDNKRKNRYINILPFDANRVKLDIVDDDPSSDYINASFIQGYSKNIEYIATQGPKEETVKDFWLMVYQYNVNIIVMVTQLEEQDKVKCHQYYPNLRETEKYGDISVKCTTELQFSIYTSRTIILVKGQERKKVVHLHFREWPDFGCPVTTDVMLQFCQIVRHQILLSNVGLTLVHCSAGVGRTGTLIALDILLQHIRENKTVDIFGVVYNLRKQRTNMVQSEAQYAYIYKCVRDALADTVYPKHDKTSTSSLEPICESAGPALNATAHDNLRPNSKSNIIVNEYEL